MNKSRTLSVACFLASSALVLVACGSEPKPAELPAVEDTAAAGLAGAMDKARAVEGTVHQQKHNIDQALQENENPTAQ
jgi:hypothetical protein